MEEKIQKNINHLRDDILNNSKETFRKKFLSFHISNQAYIFNSLDTIEQERVFNLISPKEFAPVLSKENVLKQKEIFCKFRTQTSTSSYLIKTLNYMNIDDLAKFLLQMETDQKNMIMDQLDENKTSKLKKILDYKPETAGSLMNIEFYSINEFDTAKQVLDDLRKKAPDTETIYYLYVIDYSSNFLGVVSLRELVTSPTNEVISNIMNTNTITVNEYLDQEEVAHCIQKYDLLAVPVTTETNKLLGIITVDDIMDVMEQEVTEDFDDLASTGGSSNLNLNVVTAAKRRSPWIIILMFLGLITGSVIGRYEDTLESVVLLAVFIPMIMDSAGNIGTQALGVSVRGLALNQIKKGAFIKTIFREFLIGAIIGLLCMILIALLIIIIYGNLTLALVVGVSMFCTFSISSVVGAVIPLFINKLKLDPAIASGPFITTINDIIGLFIYFSIATSLMSYL